MIKMIIADDDRLIREGLSKLISWEDYDIQIIAVTQTGDETLRQVLALNPDILLTDIEMPNMTGISLLKILHQKNNPCEVIFLSAYSNFSYAQEAVKYGAFSYLLKPVEEKALIETVISCRNRILTQKKEKLLLMQNQQIQSLVFSNSLKKLLLQDRQYDTPFADLDFLKTAGFFTDNQWCVGAIELRGTNYSACDFRNVLTPADDTSIHTLQMNETDILFVFISHSQYKDTLYSRILDCAAQLEEQFDNISKLAVSQVHSCTDIYKIYPECTFALLLSSFHESGAIVCFPEICQTSEEAFEIPPADQLLSVFSENEEEITNTLYHIFLSFSENNMLYSLHDMKLFCILFLVNIGKVRNPFSCSITDWESDFMSSFKKEIQSCTNAADLYQSMNFILHNLFSQTEQKKSKKSKIVSKALQYIQNHYADATLSDAAKRLFVSPSYLSRLFAAEMDESFSRYLMRYRVTIAKEKLKDPQYKIYEIAVSVGYSDLAHFSKAFKTIEGISPGKYRQENSVT